MVTASYLRIVSLVSQVGQSLGFKLRISGKAFQNLIWGIISLLISLKTDSFLFPSSCCCDKVSGKEAMCVYVCVCFCVCGVSSFPSSTELRGGGSVVSLGEAQRARESAHFLFVCLCVCRFQLLAPICICLCVFMRHTRTQLSSSVALIFICVCIEQNRLAGVMMSM